MRPQQRGQPPQDREPPLLLGPVGVVGFTVRIGGHGCGIACLTAGQRPRAARYFAGAAAASAGSSTASKYAFVSR